MADLLENGTQQVAELMQPFGKATFLWQQRYQLMRPHITEAYTLIAFEKQGTDKGCGDDFRIRGAATFFGFVANAFQQIIRKTVNRYNFIGEHNGDVLWCNTKLLTPLCSPSYNRKLELLL